MSTHKNVGMALTAGLAFMLSTLPAAAKPTAKPKVKTTARVTTVKGSTVQGPKVKVKTHGPAAGAQAAKAKPAKPPKPAKATGQATKPAKLTKTNGSGKKTTTDRTSPTTDRISPTEPVTQSKIQRLLEKNDNLRNKLFLRLPPNTKVAAAADGFRNLGQFVAAVNVSHNQGIDFFALKALMTGPESLSLGQAVQRLKGVDPVTANAAADTAMTSAVADLDGTQSKKKPKGRN